MVTPGGVDFFGVSVGEEAGINIMIFFQAIPIIIPFSEAKYFKE